MKCLSIQCSKRRLRKRAFTLLELLVVIAIIAILAGGIGIYRSNESAAGKLASSARMISGSVGRAKTTATMSGNATRLMVNSDSSSNGYLRELAVVEFREGTWWLVGDIVHLPSGVGVVPDQGSLLVGNWGEWKSVFSSGNTTETLNIDGRGSKDYWYIGFSSSGLPDRLSESDYMRSDVHVSSNLPQIVVSVYDRKGPNEVSFSLPQHVAGVSISARGDARIMERL